MLRLALLSAALVGALLAPTPVQVRFMVYVQPGLPVSAATVRKSIERGLFTDSLVRPYGRGTFDSVMAQARRANGDTLSRPRMAILQARISGTASSVSVCLVAMNLLAQPIVGPDTVTSTVAALDSVLASYGSRYASLLANPTWRGSSKEHCS
jgi:hypothetical protein